MRPSFYDHLHPPTIPAAQARLRYTLGTGGLGVFLTLVVGFTGAYLPPRRLNYLLGLFLLVIYLFLDFTGYVLRWDEGVHWALVAGTNLVRSIPLVGEGLYRALVGASQPGTTTLIRFYAWHLFGLIL